MQSTGKHKITKHDSMQKKKKDKCAYNERLVWTSLYSTLASPKASLQRNLNSHRLPANSCPSSKRMRRKGCLSSLRFCHKTFSESLKFSDCCSLVFEGRKNCINCLVCNFFSVMGFVFWKGDSFSVVCTLDFSNCFWTCIYSLWNH